MILACRINIVLFALIGLSVVRAGNTTCISDQLDWYTTAVGETPCTTYQRLRQICNSDYQVPNFRPDTPGDNCDDQLSDCCCNSISWALSMLCMNCQQTTSALVNGIDAGATAYALYRTRSDGGFCRPGTNHSLPDAIQTSVCNLDIRLDNFLYELFWDAGDWFYDYTKATAQQQQAQFNNNTFTHCPNQIIASSTSAPTSSTSSSSLPPPASASTSTPSSSSVQSSHVAAIAVSVAGACLLCILFVVLWLLRRRKRNAPVGLSVGEARLESPTNLDNGMITTTITPFTLLGARPPPTSVSSTYSATTNTTTQAKSAAGDSSSHMRSVSSSQTFTNSTSVPERHVDGGPLILASGPPPSPTLPPAYLSWEGENGRQQRRIVQSGSISKRVRDS